MSAAYFHNLLLPFLTTPAIRVAERLGPAPGVDTRPPRVVSDGTWSRLHKRVIFETVPGNGSKAHPDASTSRGDNQRLRTNRATGIATGGCETTPSARLGQAWNQRLERSPFRICARILVAGQLLTPDKAKKRGSGGVAGRPVRRYEKHCLP